MKLPDPGEVAPGYTLVVTNFHGDEPYAREMGEALQMDPPANTVVVDFGSTGNRLSAHCNPTSYYGQPLRRGQCSHMHNAWDLAVFIERTEPGAVVDLHNSLAKTRGDEYDSALLINRDPATRVGMFAANAVLQQGIPIIEAFDTCLPGTHPEAVMFEMDPRDPRFTYEAVWRMIGGLSTRSSKAPIDVPSYPVLATQKDITRDDARAAGVDTAIYRPPFSALDPEEALALNLHRDTRVINALDDERRSHWATALTLCRDKAPIYPYFVRELNHHCATLGSSALVAA